MKDYHNNFFRMKYFLIYNSADEKEVGCFPQTTGIFDGYNHDATNAMENLTSEELPDFVPDLRFELDEDAILTDVISPSNLDFAVGLMMNIKAKRIFENYKIITHAFYNAKIKIKNDSLEYYWMHMVNPSFEYLDFNQSIFTELLPGNKSNQHKFKTEVDFENFYTTTTNSVKAHKLVLNEASRKKNYDLLFFPFIHKGLIASEYLCNSLKEECISGVSFKEQNFI